MLSRLWVRNFRNLAEQIIEFESGVTVIVGDNNQGKTNLLEAVFCAASGKSIVGERIADLVRHNADSGVFALEVIGDTGVPIRIYREFDRRGTRAPVSDGQRVSQRDVCNDIDVVYWSADIIRSFQESADYRRDLLDQISIKSDPTYEKLIRSYSRALSQRNAALKSGSAVLVGLYTPPFIELSLKVTEIRRTVLTRVFELVNQYLHDLPLDGISNIEPILRIKRLDITRYRESMADALNESSAREYALGYTTVGAHRDDFDVLVDNRSIIQFFSRGVCRVIAVLINLSSLELWRGNRTVILVDDAFCEIADGLKGALGKMVFSKFQSVYVSTDLTDCARFGSGRYGVIQRGLLTRGKN